jgi:hypothetical protein
MTVQDRLLMLGPLLSALLSAVLWVLLSGGAARAALLDPTRPPPGLSAPSTGTAPAPRTATAGLADPAAATRPLRLAPTAVSVVPRLQGLHFPSDTPPGGATAMIDGRLFRTGDRLGDATVQEIRPDGVLLRLARGATQWIGLYALVELPTAEPLNATATATAIEQNAPRKEP